MRIVPLALAAGLACLLMSAGGANAACKAGSATLFQDHFDALDDAWGNSDNYDVEDGRLVIKPPAGYNTTTLNNFSLYDDVDICVEMTFEAPVKDEACGSIIFWAEGLDGYYAFQVFADGRASFWRRQRGRWLNQVSERVAPGAEKGPTVINELRVITSGNTARLFVNGTLFREVKGQAPKDGSLIGLLACSPSDASASVAFDNLVVNTPGAEPEPVSVTGGGDNGGAGAAAGSGGAGEKAGNGNAGAPSSGSGAPAVSGEAPSIAPAAPGGGDNNGGSGGSGK